jgi:hypothetical protein
VAAKRITSANGFGATLPTANTLLDWSMRAYVAAYFAISDALARKISHSRKDGDSGAERLAVWVLDIEKRALFRELKVITVPGGNNANLAAQSGKFTLLTQTGGRGTAFTGEMALDLYFAAQSLQPPLKKVTLPISEAPAALSLCSLYDVTGARNSLSGSFVRRVLSWFAAIAEKSTILDIWPPSDGQFLAETESLDNGWLHRAFAFRYATDSC